MTRRPALGLATAALCALLALTACQGSPEAGRPNTTPASPTPTPTPTAPSTPTWTPEQQAAITAAQARYSAARAAAGVALNNPSTATHDALEAAGNGGAWLQSVLARIVFLQDRGLYQTGTAKVVSVTPAAVNLKGEQPVVALTTCIDGAGVVMRYRASGKPVPVVSTPGGTTRHSVSARLVFAPAKSGTKMWFLIEEKTAGPC